MKNHLLTGTRNVFMFRLLTPSKKFSLSKRTLLFFSFLLVVFYQGQTKDDTPGSGKTFTVPPNVTHVNAAAWGAGGGGGGSTTRNSGGNGGGGGGAAASQIVVNSGNVFIYSIGSGGTAGAANSETSGNGGNGGNASITSLAPLTNMSANGGTGGDRNAGATVGGGGSASGGATNSPGAHGLQGGRSGGSGGNSATAFTIFGIGGNGGNGDVGIIGGQPGAGGGGGEASRTASFGGGAGAPGRVMFDFISVSAVSPSPICVGSTITITGTNFSTLGTTTVTVNGTLCTNIVVVNSTTITAVIATGSTSGVVDISNNGRRNNGKSVTVNPVVNAIGGGAASVCTGAVTPAFTNATTGGTWSITPGTGTATISAGGVVTGGTAGTVTVVYTKGCAVSVALTIISPVTGISGTPSPANGATGVCYAGGTPVTSVSWSAVANATSYDVYFGAGSLPGSVTSNVTSTSYATGTLLPNTTYYWKIVPKNGCGITSGTPTIWLFTTSALPCTCKPTTAVASNSYITDVEFRGTLNDVQNNKNGLGGSGYQDFTAMANKTRQAAGEGINVFVQSNGVDVNWKAWVDWNRDGNFNESVYNVITNPTGEIVFGSGIGAISTTFGFVISPNIPPGDYVIRIRNNRYQCGVKNGLPQYCRDTAFKACDNFTGTTYGEAEDYVITVTANCAAVINTVAMQNPLVDNCGASAVPLIAKASEGTTKIRWYNAETGGTMLAETDAVLVGGVLQATYTTPLISSTTTYWVTAFNGTCETIYRKPVTAKIKPIPELSFNLPPANANFCGEDDRLILTSSGNEELVTLIDEDFETIPTLPLMGKYFKTIKGTVDTSDTTKTGWQNQGSPFKPVGDIWSPAISSGYAPNRFAFATSDYSSKTVETILESVSDHATTNFISLNLSFSAYYSFYGDTSTATGGIVEGFFVEVSTNNGGSWTTVKTYDAENPGPDGTPSLGYGTRFRNLSVNLDAYRNMPSVKIRFRYRAYWGDGVAIDNIKLYGNRPLTTSFVWTAPNIGVFQADCVTPYEDGTTTSSICIKPSDIQIQTIADWNISAQQTVSNGCTTSATIAIHNQNKVWNTATTDWQTSNQWLPTTGIPDSDKCVIIKTPVFLSTGNGSAKNVTIEPGGTLTINKDRTLKVIDYIKNKTTVDNAKNLVVESDGNLIQINDNAVNTGSMTAKREVKNLRYLPGTFIDYVYWSSPVSGQPTKGPGGFSPGTPNNTFFYYRESNDRFYETGDPTFTPGRGYAIRAEGNTPITYTKTYEFKGTPNNGKITYPIIRSADNPTGVVHGYNLVGNPYPSNIDFNELYLGNLNGDLIYNTAWFWTNSLYTATQMGSDYGGNNYAIFNGTGGAGATSPYTGGLVPNGIIKVGQGFMVQKKTIGTAPLEFKNTYGAEHDLRKPGTESIFFQKNETGKNRFWLSLIGPAQMVNSLLIGYIPGATNDFEQDFDAEAFDDYSDLFYSVLEGKKLVIQGKSDAFTVEDRVPLGANFYQNGAYTISLDNTEGIFNTGQTIYLKDKQAGITANLSEGSYTFQATKGLSNGRFEIVYQPEIVLVTDSKVKNGVEVYRDSGDFVVKAQNKKITAIQVFDASGRLVYSVSPNSLQTVIPAGKLLNSMYVLKIDQGGIITTRKIIK